jgi:hypothetical protein
LVFSVSLAIRFNVLDARNALRGEGKQRAKRAKRQKDLFAFFALFVSPINYPARHGAPRRD